MCVVCVCADVSSVSLQDEDLERNARVIIVVGIMGVSVNALGMCIFGAHGHSHGGYVPTAFVDVLSTARVRDCRVSVLCAGRMHVWPCAAAERVRE